MDADGGGYEGGCGIPRRVARDLRLEVCSREEERRFEQACEEAGGNVEQPNEVPTCVALGTELRTPEGFTTPRI
jgi:hypothetical protein